MKALFLMNKALFLILFILGNLITAADIIPFPSLNNPESVLVYKDKIYTNEKFSISVYSLRDFKLIKKFGQEGEGPQEFRWHTRLDFHENHLVVVSQGKISYYDEFGTFIRERRARDMFLITGRFLPGEFFVSIDSFAAPKRTISIYDSNFNRVKDICKGCSRYRQGDILGNVTILHTYNGKIFAGRGHEFIIDVFDSNGVKLYSITQEDYERIKFSQKHKDEFFNSYKSHPLTRKYFPITKQTLKFPDYLPAIKKIFISNGKIYVQTFKKEKENYEFYIFDINGKLIKTVFLPIHAVYSGFVFLYPFTIQDENLYQFVENETSNVWELHITRIKF